MYVTPAAHRATSFLLLVVSIALGSTAASAAVDPTTGAYRTEASDLTVKVVGGSLSWTREYEANAWRFAPTWSALRLEIDALDDTVARIDRAGDLYEKIDSAGTLYRFDERLTIRKTESGWRWADRDGNWMEYTTTGLPQRLGNRVGNVVTLNYAGEQLTSVVDPMNRTVFTVSWTDGRISSVKDHTEREVRYSYTGGLLTQVTDVRGKPWKYEYTGGKLTKLIDPLDHATTITLSAAGRARVVTDPVGAVTRYAFDYLSGPKQYYLKTIRENGELQEVTETWTDRERELVRRDVNGVTLLTVARDGRNRIHIDYRGRRTTYLYDEFRNPTGVIYPDGSKVTSTYDTGTSNLLTTTNEIGTITEHQYYANGLRRRTIEAKGTDVERITEYAYDPQGRLTTITQVGDAVTQEAVTRYTYDDAGNVATITDAEQGVTRFDDYDSLGNAWTRIDAREKRWTQVFDASGNLLSQTDPLQNVMEHEYDDAQRRVRTIRPRAQTGAVAATTTFGFDQANRLVTTMDALGGTKHTVYDKRGNRVEERDESGIKTTYTYDAFNRLSSIIDAAGNTTRHVYVVPETDGSNAGDFYRPIGTTFPTYSRTFKFDLRGRVLQQLDRTTVGSLRTREMGWQFDAAGRTVKTVRPGPEEVLQSYDALGRPSSALDALGYTTLQRFDDRDNLVEFQNARGDRHVFSYDKLGRGESELRPGGSVRRYVHDRSGLLTATINGRGQRVVYDYDDRGLLTRIASFETESAVASKVVTFSRDNLGRLTGYDDSKTKATYTLDAVGRTTSETVDFGEFSWTHHYGFYENGQRRSHGMDGGPALSYGYDLAGRLVSVSVSGSGSIQFQEFSWTQPGKVAYPDGSVRTISYDGFLDVVGVRVADGAGNILSDVGYRLDDAGNTIEKSTEHGTYIFSYDKLHRLLKADYPNGPSNDLVDDSFEVNHFPFGDDHFSYDPIGNRLTDERQTGLKEWKYDAQGALLDFGEGQYRQDSDGNTVERLNTAGERQALFEYDEFGRLDYIEESGGDSTSHYYDPFNRKLMTRKGANTIYFAYSDLGFVGSSSNAAPPAPFYVFSPVRAWSTELLAIVDASGGAISVHVDEPGLPAVWGNGAVVSRARYTAFGEAKFQGEPIGLRFPGQLAEDGNLYWNFNRHYAPKQGRYFQPDPLGIASSENLYAYVESSPLQFIDPQGLTRFRYIECGGMNGLTYCDGFDGFTYEVCNKGCSRHCTVLHEQRHVSDYQSKFPGSCKDRDEGESPDTGWKPKPDPYGMLGDQQDPFRWETECNAEGVSFDCANQMLGMLGGLCEGEGRCADLFSDCCENIEKYRDHAKTKRDANCGAIGR